MISQGAVGYRSSLTHTTGAAIVGLPANTVLPAVTGSTTVGSTLSCSSGSWTGLPVSLAFQWLSNGTPIVGQTSSTYVIQSADQGNTLSCVVTATNTHGSTPATSNGVAIPAAGDAYVAAVMADSPAAFWPLNETSGTAAQDLTANNNPGVYSGTYTLGAAGPGTSPARLAANFAATGYVQVNDAAVLNPTTCSLELWVNFAAVGFQSLLAKSTSGTIANPYNVNVAAANVLQLIIGNGTTQTNMNAGSGTLTTGTWYHAVITHDNTSNAVVFYLNGTQVGTATASVTAVGGAVPVTISGRGSPVAQMCNGRMALAAVYPTVLSATRVAAHYAAMT